MTMSELINIGTLLKRVEELEEKVKHLEEHYNFELRKDMEEDINQLALPLEEDKDINRITSPLQNW